MADIRINALATTATTPASDDYLALDGAAQGTRKILATNIANNVTDVILGSSGPSVKSTLSARAPRQGLVFDGTAGATTSVPALGTADYTFAIWINPTSLSTSQKRLLGADSNGAFEVQIDRGTAGNIAILNQSVAVVTTTGTLLTAGKQQLITITRSGTSGVISINGVQAATFTDSQNYTAASDRIGNISTTSYYNGTLIGPLVYNRALSASEVVSLYEAGAPAGADYNSASNTTIVTGFTQSGSITSFTANATSWSGTGTAYAEIYPTGAIASLTVGKRYRLAVGTVTGTISASGGVSGSALTSNTTYDFTATATSVVFSTSTVGSIGITGISLTKLGLLLAPDAAQAGGGYVWNDQSGNLAQIVLPSSGVQWALPSVAGQRIRGTTSTNGNQQLLGASVLLPAECQITHVRARARTGTPTITIGTASGGAQIVASVALSTTWLNCTIALTGGIVSSADDIWVGSNSTDVVETDIAFQPLDF